MQREILNANGNVMMVKAILEEGEIVELHSHPEEQISYVLEGKIELDQNNLKQIFKAGGTFHIPPNIPHGVRTIKKSIILDVFHPIRGDLLD